MDLRQLQALQAIADHGSFSTAAVALGTVQSNISTRIKGLEAELDATLVDRSNGRLTPIGEVVVRRARRINAELNAMVDDVIALSSTVTGVVRVGMIGTTGRWLVPTLFATLHDSHPEVHLHVLEGTNSTLELQVAAGQLDVAILNVPVQSSDIDTFPLFTEALVIVAPVDGALAQAHRDSTAPNGYQPVALAELATLELLLPLQGTTLRDQIDAFVKPAGIALSPAIELEGIRMLASLAFDGYGPAILPASAIPIHLKSGFASIPLEGAPSRTVGVAIKRRGFPSAPTRVTVDALKELISSSDALPHGISPITVTASL
ncbi:MAG: LysR family transcriptional regulator [Actinomycetota bacterium]